MAGCPEVRFINLVDPPAAIEYSHHGQALVPLDPLASVLDLGGYRRVSVCVGSTRARSCELIAGRLGGATRSQRFVVPLDGRLHSFEVAGPQLALWLNGGTARSVNEDNGNLDYDKNDPYATTFKATHELELKYHNLGAFFRASYFWDAVNHDKSELGDAGIERVGHDFEWLDAYVHGRFEPAGKSLDMRLGSQVVSWGESTFIPNGINVINPVNVNKLRTPGAELHPALNRSDIDVVVDKGLRRDTDGYSAFESPDLLRLLREHRITDVVVVGLATDYCVLNTARDALRDGFAVTVDTSAVRAVDVTPGDGDRALAALARLGANVADLSAPGS